MGLFDNLTSLLGQGQGGEQSEGAMGIVSSLLNQGGGGHSSNVIGSLLGGLGGGAEPAADGDVMQGGQPPQQAGLAGMLESLAANGMGEHVASWLSNNPNLPISTDEIHQALGSEQVQQLAQSSGLPVGDFLRQLAEHLPTAASEAAGTQAG